MHLRHITNNKNNNNSSNYHYTLRRLTNLDAQSYTFDAIKVALCCFLVLPLCTNMATLKFKDVSPYVQKHPEAPPEDYLYKK